MFNDGPQFTLNLCKGCGNGRIYFHSNQPVVEGKQSLCHTHIFYLYMFAFYRENAFIK